MPRQRHSVTEYRYKSPVAQKIGDRIKIWRKARKITVPELAAAAGIAPTTLYDLERGVSTSTTKLYGIAKKLRISVEYLESGRGDPETGAVPHQDIPAKESWPFSIEKSRYDRLTPREKEAIDEMVTAYVSHCEVTRDVRATKRRAR